MEKVCSSYATNWEGVTLTRLFSAGEHGGLVAPLETLDAYVGGPVCDHHVFGGGKDDADNNRNSGSGKDSGAHGHPLTKG